MAISVSLSLGQLLSQDGPLRSPRLCLVKNRAVMLARPFGQVAWYTRATICSTPQNSSLATNFPCTALL